jgi:uncharacterized membrane protein
MGTMMTIATIVVAAGCAMVAGVFYGFSSFVMQGLGRLGDPEGIRAMQQINRTAVMPAFMALFMGTTVACLALAVAALVGGEGRTGAVVGGSALYVLGCFGLTMAANVPLNDRLEAADAETAESASLWRHYLSRWTAWNTVRTVAALAAAGLLVWAAID